MEGAQTDIEGKGVGPPLRVSCDQSWAFQGLSLAYMDISRVQMSSLYMGEKSVTREALHTHKMQRLMFYHVCYYYC